MKMQIGIGRGQVFAEAERERERKVGISALSNNMGKAAEAAAEGEKEEQLSCVARYLCSRDCCFDLEYDYLLCFYISLKIRVLMINCGFFGMDDEDTS